MLLIVGLGNPGKEYEKTRHNIGFRVIDELAKNKPNNMVLLKPQTFMNNSGEEVRAVATFYKIKLEDLWIIHDDVDLLIGKIKISRDRGSAGHKGVESIIKNLGSKNFNRIRIGTCPISGKPEAVDKFVLQDFTKDEEKIIKEIIERTTESIQNNAR
ncbi:MAG: aminoacyl-tRNA hydrolase [Candidatus Nealsonbacteria bacterium]